MFFFLFFVLSLYFQFDRKNKHISRHLKIQYIVNSIRNNINAKREICAKNFFFFVDVCFVYWIFDKFDSHRNGITLKTSLCFANLNLLVTFTLWTRQTDVWMWQGIEVLSASYFAHRLISNVKQFKLISSNFIVSTFCMCDWFLLWCKCTSCVICFAHTGSHPTHTYYVCCTSINSRPNTFRNSICIWINLITMQNNNRTHFTT